MSRNTQPVHFEYIEKGAWWPRWTQWASYNPHSHSQPRVQQLQQQQQQLQPQVAPTSGSTAQQPFSIVVVNNSQAAVPMDSIMRLVSHYQTQFSQPSQQPQSTQQSAQQPQQSQAPSSPPVQIVIVINGNGQIGNTDSILNRLFLAQQPQTIPTSQSFINSLQQTKITPETIAKQLQCTVCMEDFKVEDSAVQLPCLHSFHHDCIKPWLSTQHTCPVCRHELPTETQATCTPQALPTPLPVQTQQPIASFHARIPMAPQAAPLASPTPSVNTISSPSPLPTPEASPLVSPPTRTTPSTPTLTTSTTTTSTPPNSPSNSPATQRQSSLKRGFLLPPTSPQQQPQKKKRVEEAKKDEKKSEEKKDGNEFGFKKGFLCSPKK